METRTQHQRGLFIFGRASMLWFMVLYGFTITNAINGYWIAAVIIGLAAALRLNNSYESNLGRIRRKPPVTQIPVEDSPDTRVTAEKVERRR